MMTARIRRLFIVGVLSLAQVTVSSLSSNPVATCEPLYEATIDYSAANEYVEAHYGKRSPRTPYFGSAVTKEPIYDARKGVYESKSEMRKPPTLESCGFTLLKQPTRVTDWNTLSQIRNILLPELRTMLENTYSESKIRDIVFWNPMLRGKDLKQTRPQDEDSVFIPTASFAASPHIDTDIGAYENAQDLVRLIEKNKVDTSEPFPRSRLVKDIQEGRRFAIVNAWRNIAETPVVRAPLALFSVRYKDVVQLAFPQAAPDMDESKWHIFSNMTKDEVLLFCQYDRDVTRPSDLWHCALTNVGEQRDTSASPRSSFDVRCLVVFDEIVPDQHDRFGENRLASLLTQEESGCFCDKQAESRGVHQWRR